MFSFREVPDQPTTTVKYLGEINLQYVSELQVVFTSDCANIIIAEFFGGRKMHWTTFL